LTAHPSCFHTKLLTASHPQAFIMDNTFLPLLGGDLAAFHSQSQVAPPPQTQTLALTPPDSSDDSEKSDDTISTPILSPAVIEIKRKIDSGIAALQGATKDLERFGKPGTLDRLGYQELEVLSRGMRLLLELSLTNPCTWLHERMKL